MMAFSASAINLASQPFRRERAQNAAMAAGSVLLLLSLVMFCGLILRSRSQAADLRKVIENQRAQLARLQRTHQQYSDVLLKPGNADVFAQSVLLNELIAHRTVSWTRVFADLETVLPNNMRLLSIRLPQVAAENGTERNRVQLDMWVGTEQPAAVIAFLKKLESSNLFGDASVMSQTPPTQNDPNYKYRVTVSYAQQL